MIFGKLVFEVESDFIFKKICKEDALISMQHAVTDAKNFNGFGNNFSNDDRVIFNSRIKILSQTAEVDKDAEKVFNDRLDKLLDEIFFEVQSTRQMR